MTEVFADLCCIALSLCGEKLFDPSYFEDGSSIFISWKLVLTENYNEKQIDLLSVFKGIVFTQ